MSRPASHRPAAASSPTTTPSRIERRKTEFRDRITQAALKLFEANGVAETSIAAIIKEADIAHKTFFNHFPSKDHLLQHIVSSHSETAYSQFRETFEKYRDPQKRLKYCLMSIAVTLEQLNPQRYRELLTFYFVSSASTREFREKQKQDFSGLITQILQHAQERKQLRSHLGVDVMSEIVVDICVATLLRWCVEENYPIVEKMKQAVEFINEAIFVEEATAR